MEDKTATFNIDKTELNFTYFFKYLKMKKLAFCLKQLVVLLILAVAIFSCHQPATETTTAATTSLKDYFSYSDSVEGGGVKMIPIKTPVGDFKVWTKRFGNNPKIKILLLHGGPAMTHEYTECFETFFQREGFEF